MRVAVSSRPCGTSPGTSSAPAVSPARCWAGRSPGICWIPCAAAWGTGRAGAEPAVRRSSMAGRGTPAPARAHGPARPPGTRPARAGPPPARGQAAGADRPVGNLRDLGGDLLEGREIDGDFGHLDVTAQGAWSAGANGSTDPFGNMSGTIGLRGGMELGADARLNGPDGTGIETSSQIGMEAYAEAGGTIGPDGLALGASTGSGVYASNTATLDGGDHGSLTYGHTAFAGADASANAWSHATRNEDGDVNGWTVGADARAFAGAELKHTFAAEAPGGWGFVEGSASALGGGGIGGGYGATLSTDEVSISLSGTVAKGLGLEGSGTIGINPNAIVDSFTPGDYNLDDMISDGADLVDRGKDWLSDINPF